MSSSWIRNGIIGLFVSVLIFELFNYIQVLTFAVDFTWFGRMISTLTVFGTLSIVDRALYKKRGIRLHAVAWCAGFLLLAVDFTGDVFRFYSRWPWYDQYAHFLSGPFVVSAFFVSLKQAAILGWHRTERMRLMAAVCINIVFAILYEMEEYFEDLLTDSHRWGGMRDSASDLSMNVLGAGLMVIAILCYYAFRPRMELPEPANENVR